MPVNLIQKLLLSDLADKVNILKGEINFLTKNLEYLLGTSYDEKNISRLDDRADPKGIFVILRKALSSISKSVPSETINENIDISNSAVLASVYRRRMEELSKFIDPDGGSSTSLLAADGLPSDLYTTSENLPENE